MASIPSSPVATPRRRRASTTFNALNINKSSTEDLLQFFETTINEVTKVPQQMLSLIDPSGSKNNTEEQKEHKQLSEEKNDVDWAQFEAENLMEEFVIQLDHLFDDTRSLLYETSSAISAQDRSLHWSAQPAGKQPAFNMMHSPQRNTFVSPQSDQGENKEPTTPSPAKQDLSREVTPESASNLEMHSHEGNYAPVKRFEFATPAPRAPTNVTPYANNSLSPPSGKAGQGMVPQQQRAFTPNSYNHANSGASGNWMTSPTPKLSDFYSSSKSPNTALAGVASPTSLDALQKQIDALQQQRNRSKQSTPTHPRSAPVSPHSKNLAKRVSTTGNVHLPRARVGKERLYETLPLINKADFRLIKVLGKGSFGSVYLVDYKGSVQTYALKTMEICDKNDSAMSKSEKQRMEQLENEIQVLQETGKNAFLVSSHAILRDETRVYFVLDSCLGGELSDVLRLRRRFPESTARFVAACIILAVDVLHSRKFVHCDIKPENLLLDSQGYVRLTDFGNTKSVQHGKVTTLVGSVNYCCPEILSRTPHGLDADWWAVGVMVHEMVAGNTPFGGIDSATTRNVILNDQFVPPPFFSEPLQDFLSGLLRTNPSKRLGHNGAKELKAHPWLSSVNWDALAQRLWHSPIDVVIMSDRDTSNFRAASAVDPSCSIARDFLSLGS